MKRFYTILIISLLIGMTSCAGNRYTSSSKARYTNFKGHKSAQWKPVKKGVKKAEQKKLMSPIKKGSALNSVKATNGFNEIGSIVLNVLAILGLLYLIIFSGSPIVVAFSLIVLLFLAIRWVVSAIFGAIFMGLLDFFIEIL